MKAVYQSFKQHRNGSCIELVVEVEHSWCPVPVVKMPFEIVVLSVEYNLFSLLAE